MTTQQRIDVAVAEMIAGRILAGGSLPDVGESVTFDARLGDEGPGSYTRIEASVGAADLAAAARLATEIEAEHGL